MRISFSYGTVVPFDTLPSNSIALDGYVQGPAVDAAGRRFSFDHHAGCIRAVTLATCQQVAVALRLGLIVDAETEVFANDLDADTVLACWLLQRGETVLRDPRVADLVERVGLTDSHGPLFPAHPLHGALGPRWGSKDPQTLDMLFSFLAVLDRWFETGECPPEPAPRPAVGFGLRATGGWEPITSSDAFVGVYSQGYLAAALRAEAADGSAMWTIGKRSDFVSLPVGPADLSADRSGQYAPTLLGALAQAEHAAGCPHAENWGGGSSIGGSPRRAGGIGSRLSDEQVLEILSRFTIA